MMRMVAIIACTLGLIVIIGQVEGGAKAQKPYLLAQGAPASQASTPTYADIADIVSKYHCTVCHGAVEPRSGLSLDSYKSIMQGGKHGPIVRAGEPAKSELIRRVKGITEPRMPVTGPPWLSEDEIGTIERWITAGAPEGKK